MQPKYNTSQHVKVIKTSTSSTPFRQKSSQKRSPYNIKLSRLSLASPQVFSYATKKQSGNYSFQQYAPLEEPAQSAYGVFLPATTRRAKFFSFHSDTESDQKPSEKIVQRRIQLGVKKELTFGNKSITQLMPIRVSLFFSLERMQKRLLSLIKTSQQLESRRIKKHLEDSQPSTIEEISLHIPNFKRYTSNEALALILKFMLDINMTTGVDQMKLEKVIVYAHQGNALSAVQQLQIKSPSIATYINQYYQFQLMNPTIPSQVDKMNAYFDSLLERLIKNIQDRELKDEVRLCKEGFNSSPFKRTLDCLRSVMAKLDAELVVLPRNDEVYTLVLDLDETLIHMVESAQQQQVVVRPHVHEFLEAMSKCYEIVIFTASVQSYADQIINLIDVNKRISYRLYRHHTYMEEDTILKDLNILGRPLSRTVIVDNNPYNFALQPENGIRIQTWTGCQQDKALKELIPYLQQVSEYKDVRVAMKQIKNISQYFTTS